MDEQREAWRLQTDGLWANRQRNLHSANSLRRKLTAYERACQDVEAKILQRRCELADVRQRVAEAAAILEQKRENVNTLRVEVDTLRKGKVEDMQRRQGRRRCPETANHMVRKVYDLEYRIRRYGALVPGSDVGYDYLLQV